AGRVERALDCDAFVARHGDRLFKGDQLRAAPDSKLDERQTDIWRRAEAEDVGFDLFHDFLRVRPTLGGAKLRGRRFETFLITVGQAHEFEPWIRGKCGSVVHAALARADDGDAVASW